MDPAVLWQQISDPCPESSPFQSSFFPDQQIADGISAVEWNLASEFNRVTNDSVQDVCRDHPSLFEGWTDEEWDELYSTFGVGGALNEQGILQQAEAINRKRETLYQVHVLLETHLAEAARGVIESLYRAVECEQLQDQSSVSDLSRRKAGKSL